MNATVRETARARIQRVADDLHHVRKHLVFIGGSVLPLLVDVDQRFDTPRVTKDVDAVSAAATYTRSHEIEDAIRGAKYQNDTGSRNMRRFIAPSGEIFDLSFAGDYAGATGALVDKMAIATAIQMEGRPDIRHLSPTGLFLMKVAAFRDRGEAAPAESRDLSDIAVLLIGADVEADLRNRTDDVRAEVAKSAQRLASLPALRSALLGHFRDRAPIPPDTPESLTEQARRVIHALCTVE